MSDVTDVVLGSTVIIVGTTMLRIERTKTDKTPAGTMFKPVLFGFGLATMLLAIAIAAPGVAKGLAYLGLVGAFALNGPALFGTIGGLGQVKTK